MSSYPIFLKLEDRRVLVVGAGPVGRERIAQLAAHGAQVFVVAPNAADVVTEASEIAARAFRESDVDGAWLVIAAATPEVNREVRAACDARRVFVVAVDDSASCSAIGAARLDRGGITIAISSDGRAPALVSLLRRALDKLLPDEIGAWTEIAERTRAEHRATNVPFVKRRPLLLEALVDLYRAGAA